MAKGIPGLTRRSSRPNKQPRRATTHTVSQADIRGALGTIRDTDPRRTLKSRFLALLAIMGPGLIVMVGDNDAGGVATYSQAGQNYGTSLLWTLLLLIPVLVVNQEMVVRLGAVTGIGHARLIFERFGRFWGSYSVTNLFVLNFFTLVTEFIGISLALGYFGLSRFIAVPLAVVMLGAITLTGNFRRWEGFMYVFIFANFLVLPLLIFSHPHFPAIAQGTFVPHVQGGLKSEAVLLIISIVGTTVAPWQLFFQQSNVIDKRITSRWINYERVDTIVGAFVTVLGAGALIAITAFAFGGTPLQGAFSDAGGVASGLQHTLGDTAGAFYAIVLLNASLIGAAAVTLATSYAVGDAFGAHHSLHKSLKDAKLFYTSFMLCIALAGAIVLIPKAPLGLITQSVQALAGLLLPNATVFLLLLCNDRQVLGPWVNPRWLNAVASVIVAVLLTLSATLVITTLFSDLDVRVVVSVLGGLFFGGLCLGGVVALRRSARQAPQAPATVPREEWTMAPLALLERPSWSGARKAGMYMMGGYLLVTVALLIVKAIELAS